MRTVAAVERGVWLAILLVGIPVPVPAYDVSEEFSLEATLTGVYQYADFGKGTAPKDTGRGVMVLDAGANYHPTDSDEFNLAVSFAVGHGLNGVEAFTLAPFADDLEDDVENINGRNRDYLLEAWYKHTFSFSQETALGATLGIIDATAYIDNNEFANDETAQFMNDAFVNNPLANLPSYDAGGALEFRAADLSLHGVIMNSKNEDNEHYNYYALQVGYALQSAWGEGHYRLYGFITDREFLDAAEEDKERLRGIGLSLDQETGEKVGVFARLGWQDDAAAVDHEALYSAGLHIAGKLWGREGDEAGLGYAYLSGARHSDIDNTQALEGYVKVQVSEYGDASFDIQYVQDELKEEKDQRGWIYGIRLNAYF